MTELPSEIGGSSNLRACRGEAREEARQECVLKCHESSTLRVPGRVESGAEAGGSRTFRGDFQVHDTSQLWSLEVPYEEISRPRLCGGDGQDLEKGHVHMWVPCLL